MLQSKTGLWIAGLAAAVVLVSVGYGMGRRAGGTVSDASRALTPAGAPLPPIQIEPIHPQEELAAISKTPAQEASTAQQNPPAPAASAAPSQVASSAGQGIPAEESARVREVQRALKAAGFDPGPTDGHLGTRTRTAIRDFQTQQGLEPDGKVGPRTWSKLEPFLNKQSTSGD
ncbi:MAG: peptidoglycan-binding protein [Candidatus Omnitrophica bacterium]|nr:peptidoglycan-binding protein [Candidatus Omnitrophota bacterium]